MPLTFLTGFFGMNFFQPSVPGLEVWTGRGALVVVLTLMGLMPFFMYIWMRRRAWM